MNAKNKFWCTPIYIGNIIYLAEIVRALSSNKIVFLHFCKKSQYFNSYKTAGEVNEYLDNIIGTKMAHYIIQWQNFEVHL